MKTCNHCYRNFIGTHHCQLTGFIITEDDTVNLMQTYGTMESVPLDQEEPKEQL